VRKTDSSNQGDLFGLEIPDKRRTTKSH